MAVLCWATLLMFFSLSWKACSRATASAMLVMGSANVDIGLKDLFTKAFHSSLAWGYTIDRTHSISTWILHNTLNSTSSVLPLPFFLGEARMFLSVASTTRIFIVIMWFPTNGTNLLTSIFIPPTWPTHAKASCVYVNLIPTNLDKLLVISSLLRWWWS